MPLRGALLAAVLLVALCAVAPKASAIILHLKGGATISYQRAPGARARVATGLSSRPFDAALANLDYNGGSVAPSGTTYAVYWTPPGAPAFPSDYESGVNRFFEDLAHDSGGHENVDSVAGQYNDAAGEFATYNSTFGGALVDEGPYPENGCSHAPKCLTDEQIRSELVKFVSAHHLPTDLNHEYFLLTPEGVENCVLFEAEGRAREACSANVADEFHEYCAYHSNIQLAGGGVLIYASDPFVNGKNCDTANHPNGSSDSVLIGGLSHEHVESITDPEPNHGWVDWSGEEPLEIGDKCVSEYGTPLATAANGANYNQVINGHFYWYQEEWSNQTHQCLQRFTFSGEEPSATFTSEALAGTEIKFDASGSTTGAGIRYNWQFNDTGHSPSKSSTVETESPSVTHKFSGAEKFLVALTVMRSDGTSIGTARTIAVGAAPTAETGSPKPVVQPAPENGLTSASALSPKPVFQPHPDSRLTSVSAVVNRTTGAIAFTLSVADPGTLGWRMTFQNGKFGGFSASAARCKPHFVSLRRRCRPARIVFAKGSEAVATAGIVSFTAKPSASALRALQQALARKRGLPVAVKLTFQSALGGTAAAHKQSLLVTARE